MTISMDQASSVLAKNMPCPLVLVGSSHRKVTCEEEDEALEGSSSQNSL